LPSCWDFHWEFEVFALPAVRSLDSPEVLLTCQVVVACNALPVVAEVTELFLEFFLPHVVELAAFFV
jgi:hypothetical protein